MPLNDIKQVRLCAQFGNQISLNIRQYRVLTIVGIERTDQQMAAAFDAVIAGPMKALLATAATWRGTGVKSIFPLAQIEFASTANAGVGGLAGDPLPPQTAGIIGFQTLTPGPHGHGRMYTPFPTESVNDANGLPTAAYQVLMATVLTNLHTTFASTSGGNTTTWQPVIWNRLTHTYIDLLNGTGYVRSRWGTQRRRGGFGAANQLPF